MKTIVVPASGYYDRSNEKVMLLAKGDILQVSEHQYDAPCRSKEGKGVWAIGKCLNSGEVGAVFIDFV